MVELILHRLLEHVQLRRRADEDIMAELRRLRRQDDLELDVDVRFQGQVHVFKTAMAINVSST